MRKHLMIFGVLAMMLLVAGCDENGDTGTETRNPFRGGTESLSISFDNDNPPSEVFDDTPFYVGINVRNTGEYTVPEDEMEIRIRGVNPEVYGLTNSDLIKGPTTTLEGTVFDVNRNLIEGTHDYIEFGPFDYSESLSTRIGVPIQANACYSYGTEVVSELCIKEDTRDEPGDVCDIDEDKTYYNSAGPVQVTSVRQTPRGASRVDFSFRVEHRGVGTLYSRGASCDTSESGVEENQVFIDVDGPAGLDCTSLEGGGTSGNIRVTEGSRLVTCSLDISDATSAYIEPISINMEYTYRQVITKNVDVKPVN